MRSSTDWRRNRRVQRRFGRGQRLDAAGRNGTAHARDQTVVGAQIRSPAGERETVELQQEPADRQHAEQHERRGHQHDREHDAGQDRVGHAESGQPVGRLAERQAVRGGPQDRLEEPPSGRPCASTPRAAATTTKPLFETMPSFNQFTGRHPKQQAVARTGVGRGHPRRPRVRTLDGAQRPRPARSYRDAPRRAGRVPARPAAPRTRGRASRPPRSSDSTRMTASGRVPLAVSTRTSATRQRRVQGVLHEVDVLDALVGGCGARCGSGCRRAPPSRPARGGSGRPGTGPGRRRSRDR